MPELRWEGIWGRRQKWKDIINTDPAKQPTGPQQLQGLSMALPGQRFPPHAGLQGPPPPPPGPSATTAPAPAFWGIPAEGPTACYPPSTVRVHCCTQRTQAHGPLTLH